jgi:hypothetical protein
MITPEKRDLQDIAILKRVPEFMRFIDMLNKSTNFLAISNASIKDETQMHWNQGKIQELLSILKTVKNAEEELRQFKDAPTHKDS